MRPVRVSEDIVPVSDFKAQAADWLKRVADTGQPVVITQNGKAAGVLVSPAELDRLTDRARFLDAVDQGLADAQAGRAVSHDEVVGEMKRRAAGRKRARCAVGDAPRPRRRRASHGPSGLSPICARSTTTSRPTIPSPQSDGWHG